MAHKTETDLIEHTHNTARFFAEHRQVSFILLLFTFLAGWYGYSHMPKRKDPVIPVRVAVATTQWPGATALQVEQLVTRPIEQSMAENPYVKAPVPSDFGIKSLSLPGFSAVYVQLDDSVRDTRKQFNEINLKLNALSSSLPQGAGPIQFNGNFGDTAALMLTIASPHVSEIEVALRARSIRKAIEQIRTSELRRAPQPRVSIVYCFPPSVSPNQIQNAFKLVANIGSQHNIFTDPRAFQGSGFIGLDVSTHLDDASLREWGDHFMQNYFHRSEIHPDAWQAAFIRNPENTEEKLQAVAGDQYSYKELDNFSDLIHRTLQESPEVARIDIKGVLSEQINLNYSQERLAAYGVTPSNLKSVLAAQNITLPGGALDVGSKSILIDPSGRFVNAASIGNVIIGTSSTAARSPIYLRDLVDISRGYQSPARYLNYLTHLDSDGKWYRSRAVTLAVMMKDGQQIGDFGKSVTEKLAAVKHYLPDNLIFARTSDQPLQVKENIDLFMDSLYEAIALVVVVSLIGFWEWRSALLMAISIPITLAMTFAMMYVLGIDIQQVSVATLIIALGLLVDDPVVAGDAIKRSLAEGYSNSIAAWLGPTKLAKAIAYATITNIVAYLPFLLITGSTRYFLFSLPIVMTCSLLASRLVSMTFLPYLGYYILRPDTKPEKPIEERRKSGFTGYYTRAAKYSIEHRWKFFIASLLFLVLGGVIFSQLRTSFFPEDVQYWSYLDIWLPNDTNLDTTNQTALQAEKIIRGAAEKYGREHPDSDGKPSHVLKYMTTFVGGGGPRFWFSLSPQMPQTNYAQIVIQVTQKDITPQFTRELQPILNSSVPGARIDVRQLLTSPVDYPIEVRISSTSDVNSTKETSDIQTLRRIAGQVEDIFHAIPTARRIRNDWDEQSAQVKLEVNADRANLAGITNMDVATSSTAAMSGMNMTAIQEGDKQIPVVARLRMSERSQLSDIRNLYIYGSQDNSKVPLGQISNVVQSLVTGRIVRLDQFRTISVRAFPATGILSSQVLKVAMPKLQALEKNLPPGYRIQIGGEHDKTARGFKNLAMVMGISIIAIFLALLFQFNNAIKPMLVLAAAPYGMVGAFAALWIMNEPFGFMAFLGVASLVGVIVSHSIVLFDFIEERHEAGDSFEDAIIDAGILRLRPVLITVFATVLALVPLTLHGGPLWRPLCYAQIGGLLLATIVTKLQVPCMYAIFVLDLKILKWDSHGGPALPSTASASEES